MVLAQLLHTVRMIMRVTTVMGVPIDSVGASSQAARAFGTELMPGALRAAGLTEALAERGVTDRGDLPVRIVGSERDASSGLVGWPSATDVTTRVRTAVAE